MKRRRIDVRWHGRGGQGAVTAAMILAEAAYYEGYRGVTAAPFFGAERRGAPVIATTRFGREPIRTFSLVEYPDIVVVLDETLLKVVSVAAGVRPDGLVLVNSPRPPEEIHLDAPLNVATTDAGEWAKRAGLVVAGNVIVNTSILGGVAGATGLISLENLEKALRDHFGEEAGDRNVQAARSAYSGVRMLKDFTLACA
ncbi:MAG TPA: 2-oxoacid:acceptor oxidoreductase family protein [Syntrophobacteraceae bacterium]|nr:2-oxoacid:acceptor oxidoreductase family protein [Syntrophobacteraceae bacterium]